MKDNPETPSGKNRSAHGETGSASPSASSGPRRGVNPRRRKPAPPRKLIETRGPEPTSPLADVKLMVGRLGGSHGVRGEVKLRILSDEPENLTRVKTVYLGDRPEPVGLQSARMINDGMILKLEGYDTPEDVARLTGLAVKISGADARPLEEGEYFLFQLIGLTAETVEGEPLGTVTDLIETGAHDVLVIGERPDSPEDLLVPNHPEFVKDMLVSEGRIIISPPVWED